MSLSLSFLNLSLNLSLNLWFVKARHRPGCFYAESKRLCCSTGVDLKDRWRNLQKREQKVDAPAGGVTKRKRTPLPPLEDASGKPEGPRAVPLPAVKCGRPRKHAKKTTPPAGEKPALAQKKPPPKRATRGQAATVTTAAPGVATTASPAAKATADSKDTGARR